MSIVVGDPRPAVRPFVPLSTTRTVCPPAPLSLSPTYYDSDIHGDLYEVHSPLSPPRPSSRSLRPHLCCLDDLVLILGGSSHGSVRSFCLNELPRAMLCGVDHSDSHHCVRPHFTPSPGSRRASRSDWLVQGSRWADHDGTRRPITEQEYAQLSDQAMDTLHDSLEELVEGDEGAQGGWEVEYNSGVLTLIMGSHGTYVINKQPPNRQIWLSSPVSGPKRFDFSAETGEWFYPRDGSLLGGLLESELSEMAGRSVELGLLAREP